ncbi:hypothetical protein TorRG33x02_241540 [Trema orientale]|uniref:Uncharacterized protein n=1 Tax=Trema orientale TaxID=63057 RepID=A0A2P5DUN8_TREOI|nr:hypothetical protein TorRG33x02_241540 [Trema orientale]
MKLVLGFIPLSFSFPLLQQASSFLIGLRGLFLGLFGLKRLELRMVVIGHTQERESVAEEIDGCHRILNHRPRERDEQPVLDHARDVHGQRRGLPDEQEHGEVEREGAEGVGPEDGEVEVEARALPQNRVLDEDPRHEEEDEAARCHVVERGDGVERDPLRGEQDLDHDEPRGLEGHGAELEEDTPGVESGLAVGGHGDAEGDREHVDHGVGLEGLLLEDDADGVNGDGHEGLEHLDEGDGEVDVGGVGEPEGERVEGPDGDDGGEVEVAGHGDRLDDLEDADEEEGEGGAEGHVDHGEGDREWPVVHLLVEDVLVVDDDGETQEDPYGDVGVGEQDLLHHALA